MSGRHPALAERDDAGLVIVDVQEAFAPVIDAFDEVVASCGLLAEGFGVMGRPVIVTEQYPKGLGHTVAALADRLPAGTPVIEKTRFSACGVEARETSPTRKRAHSSRAMRAATSSQSVSAFEGVLRSRAASS